MGAAAELRDEWRPLGAATVGLAFGYTFNNYVSNVVAPHLIAEFKWDRAGFALLGLIVVVAIVCQPIAGRLADRFGERRIALIGVASAPLLYVMLSRMTGGFWQFVVISIVQVVLVGGTTSVVVYTRLIAGAFNKSRGVALGVASCAPALAGAAAAPLLAAAIAEAGWRVTYLWIAIVVAAFGALAILLIPSKRAAPANDREAPAVPASKLDYVGLLSNGPFRLIMAGMLLCNLTITLQMSQISVLLSDLKVASTGAAALISLYGGSAIVGRLVCGFALDRFPPPRVAALAMAAPAIGLAVLASGTDSLPAIAFALGTLGLALGAEGDVGTYLVMRYFDRSFYSSVVGLVIAALSASGAIGALLLSATLAATGGFSTFLLISAIASAVGGALFLSLGRHAARGSAQSPATVLEPA